MTHTDIDFQFSFTPFNHMYALLGMLVGIGGFVNDQRKICDLDLDFALQWTRIDIDFNLFSFTPLIMYAYLVGL